MYDVLSIGDTSHNVFLELSPDDVKITPDPEGDYSQISFDWGNKFAVKKLDDTIGGNSANAAVSFSRLKCNTVFYTHVGKDDQGERVIRTLQKDNINTDFIAEDGDKATNFSTILHFGGERTILVYHEHRHYHLPEMDGARWIYLSSMGDGSEAIFSQIVEYTKKHGSQLCYQPGTFQLKLGKGPAEELLKNTTVFMVNKEEAEMYLGFDEPADNMRDLLDGVRALGPHIALVTDGPDGAYVSNGDEYLYLGIIEDAPRNEATGAGDSFSSAFAAALAAGKNLGEALVWGQIQATGVIREIGPQKGLRTPEEFEAVRARFPQLQPVHLKEDGTHEYSGVPKGTDPEAQKGF